MRQNTEKQCPSSLPGEHLSVELADCPLLAALCPWRVLTQSPASQNLQCAHMRAHTCPNTHTHTHSQIHPLTHPCKTHWRLLCFAVCQYPVLIHKTDQGLIPASCLSPARWKPLERERQIQLGWNALMTSRIPTKLSLAAVFNLDPLEFSQARGLLKEQKIIFYKSKQRNKGALLGTIKHRTEIMMI